MKYKEIKDNEEVVECQVKLVLPQFYVFYFIPNLKR